MYEARSDSYEHPVALKVSKHPVLDSSTAVRALREARILRSLSNAHVVRAYEHGLGADDRWFLVMQRLDGEDLGSHDFDVPMPAHDAIRIVRQACLGLQGAHRAGIVHRDVKPGNIWREANGNVKLLDFGLARSWDDETIVGTNATQGHILIGTPHFAQPEQVRRAQLSPASDVYSLGLVLYELLCGHMPLFADQSVSEVRRELEDRPLLWLSAHLERPYVGIERYAEGEALSEQLRTVLRACLDKDPKGRPANAGELANLLAWELPLSHGGVQGASGIVLEEVRPTSSCPRRFLLESGAHRIGLGACCDIELGDDTLGWVFATLWWDGGHAQPVLDPMRTDGFVKVDGKATTTITPVQVGQTIELGPHKLTVMPC